MPRNPRKQSDGQKCVSVWLTEDVYLKFRQLAYTGNRTQVALARYLVLKAIKNAKKTHL